MNFFYYYLMFIFLLFLWFIIFFSNNPIYIIMAFMGIVLQLVLNLILINFDFFAYMLLIIYMGSIVVLFLFFTMLASIEVMTLEFRFSKIYCFLMMIIGLSFYYGSFCSMYYMNTNFSIVNVTEYLNIIEYLSMYSSLEILSWILYTRYACMLMLISLLLLMALIAPIVLTLNVGMMNLKKQVIAVQLNQKMLNSIYHYKLNF